ncbi:aminoglycoside phosphotransferase family protein [Paenibacillus sp. MER 180]|uniref:phosphotransferase family protein n=1 Tax=Paenibacillus sp. MER 180 TaxID=2939570 RepID=UPI00203D050E|nr:aminoglycoside phosphotransferase family protein [Paenibacillus sp. MER 180]MCM3291372.1 aminoglycoside phosphotransferase family protein [Paenibacillus sp. MER 180]
MSHAFAKEIHNWDSWGAVYQSIEDFRQLIEVIYRKENLSGAEHIFQLTPGTNAVFRAGSYVIKIFAPKESGANTDADYQAELSAMERAIQQGIHAPNVIAASYIQDKYLFRYIIMDFIQGQEAGKVLTGWTLPQKEAFVKQLLANLDKLNTLPSEHVDASAIKQRVVRNTRWNFFSESIRAQIAEIVTESPISQPVYVHGDITAENVMVDDEGQLFIIDFADSTIAPAEYEYPPILFSLFDFDADLIQLFRREIGCGRAAFIDKLFLATLLHEFGFVFVKMICEKYSDQDAHALTDIYEVKRMLQAHLPM